MKFLKKQKSRGFTLVEIIVVIAIIATLSAISFAAFNVLIRRSNDKATSARIVFIESKLARYLSDGNTLPANAETDGRLTSSAYLYAVLTGDINSDGKLDANDYNKSNSTIVEGEESLWGELLADAQLSISSPGSGKMTKLEGGVMVIIDANKNPLRYFRKVETETDPVSGTETTKLILNKNKYSDGYDLWGAGEDGVTKDDSDTVPSQDNGMLDDVTNWSE